MNRVEEECPSYVRHGGPDDYTSQTSTNKQTRVTTPGPKELVSIVTACAPTTGPMEKVSVCL